MIRDAERQTYDAVWDVPAYADHSPGERHVALFMDMAGARRGTVLDAGCGSGKGGLALQAAGFAVECCDLTAVGLVPEARALPFTPVCLWDDLSTAFGYRFGRKFDWIYCCDVLEHVPPHFTMLVVRRLLDISRNGVFLSIALQPDNFGMWIGKPLHQTVQPFTWWRDALKELGTVIECRDLLVSGVYLVAPK